MQQLRSRSCKLRSSWSRDGGKVDCSIENFILKFNLMQQNPSSEGILVVILIIVVVTRRGWCGNAQQGLNTGRCNMDGAVMVRVLFMFMFTILI
jgi:hypothetical protein